MYRNAHFQQIICQCLAAGYRIAIDKYFIYHIIFYIFKEIICICYHRNAPDNFSLTHCIHYNNSVHGKFPIWQIFKFLKTALHQFICRYHYHGRQISVIHHLFLNKILKPGTTDKFKNHRQSPEHQENLSGKVRLSGPVSIYHHSSNNDCCMNNNMLKFLRILSPQNALIGFAEKYHADINQNKDYR